MSENGEENQQGPRRGNSNEKELASQQIQIQSKRFYIDVKENQRGRFIKLAEVGVGGRKSRILMTMNAAEEFKTHLVEFNDVHAKMTPTENSGNKETKVNGSDSQNENDKENDGLIKSETFSKDRKRYFMDLKQNQRGVFLRISMVVPGPRGARTQVAIPAQGLAEFKDQFSDMLERYNTQPQSDTNEQPVDLPESKSIRADNKTFFFDCGSNQRGNYLKISEVRLNRYRTSITIPEKYVAQFVEQIKEFADRSLVNESSKDQIEGLKNGKLEAPVVTTTEKVTAALAATSLTEPVK